MEITHASLFSGIGGFDLAAQWMGWNNVFQVEINQRAQRVLIKNFPQVKRYGDIKEFDGTEYTDSIDVLTGGFPCQPFSTAGSRKGRDDDRYLWPEMLRVIREVRPRYVVAENVPGLLSQARGLVFETVCSEMEAEGYEIQPLNIPACAVQAQHRRERIWIIGCLSNPSVFRSRGIKEIQEGQQPIGGGQAQRFVDPLYRDDSRRYHTCESEFGGVADGIPDWMDRVESLGNAIVPHVAFQIFLCIDFLLQQSTITPVVTQLNNNR